MENYNFIIDVFENIDIFLIIFSRIIGFFIILPIFAGNNIPSISKVGFATIIALLVYYNKGFSYDIDYNYNLLTFGIIIIKEFFTGFIFSYVIYLIFSVMYLIGQLIDQTIGFSMVSVFDPVNQLQVPITGNLLYMLIIIFLIITGGLHNLIEAIIDSFDILPIFNANIINNDILVMYLLELIARYFYIGLQISMPIIGALLIIDIALGLLVKAIPQMNIFVVGLPLKLLLGLLLLYFIMPIFLNTYEIIFKYVCDIIINIIEDLNVHGI